MHKSSSDATEALKTSLPDDAHTAADVYRQNSGEHEKTVYRQFQNYFSQKCCTVKLQRGKLKKPPHESLIKIFYKHTVTEVGRDLWSSSGPTPPKAQPT